MQRTHLAHSRAADGLARIGARLVTSEPINVHPTERLASAIAGGMALAWGLGQRSAAGKVAALLGGGLVYRGVSGRCGMYRALGVDTSNAQGVLPRLAAGGRRQHVDVIRGVTIQKTPQEIYAAWKRPEVLRSVLKHVGDVEPLAEGAMRWTLRDPLGNAQACEVQVVEDVPNQRIRWASRDAPSILQHGRLDLRPAPGDRGTEVRLQLHFERPVGWLGDLLTKVLGNVPGALEQRALRNLRSLLEAGEVPSLEKNPAARPSAAP